MILPDTNVVLAAFRAEHPHHDLAHRALTDARADGTPILLPDTMLASVLRLATNGRIFSPPATTDVTLTFVRELSAEPGQPVFCTHGVWSRFTSSCTDLSIRANDVPDALLAAFATHHDATLVTLDRGFARYPDLRYDCLLDA